MANLSAHLDQAFSALADPTRRAILSRLRSGPKSVSELSEPFDLALPSLLKHVRVLERSGLLSSAKSGRVRTCTIQRSALEATEAWIRLHVSSWEERLDRLEGHVERNRRKD